jgi:methylene-tetrahydromethanopterin dehydrogenase
MGIEGIKRNDLGAPLIHALSSQGAVGVGALAVGNVKYQLQHEMLKLMLETDKSLYLDFREAFIKARDLV